MLGLAPPTFGSYTVMSIQSHTHLTVAKNIRYDSAVIGLRGGFRLSLPVGFASIQGSFSEAVAAVDSDHLISSDPSNKEKQDEVTKYHFVVANAKFMLDEEEHFKEQLFERRRHYGEKNKEHDFWLVVEPKFLDQFPEITKRLRKPAVALVSTNGPWITFIKLRLDRVLQESFEANSLEEALASNPANLEFEKPEKWLAPYPKYEYGWWHPFSAPVQKKRNRL